MKKKTQKTPRQYGGVQGELRINERREKLIRAALEAFGTIGYAKTSILTICKLAGLTERYFYESFDNKEELLCALHRKLSSELESEAFAIIKHSEYNPEKAARAAFEMLFQYFKTDPRRTRVQLFEILGVSPKVDGEYQTAMRSMAEMIKLFLQNAFPDNSENINSRIIATGLAGAILQIANEWTLDGFVTPIDEIVSHSMGIFNAIGKHLTEK